MPGQTVRTGTRAWGNFWIPWVWLISIWDQYLFDA